MKIRSITVFGEKADRFGYFVHCRNNGLALDTAPAFAPVGPVGMVRFESGEDSLMIHDFDLGRVPAAARALYRRLWVESSAIVVASETSESSELEQVLSELRAQLETDRKTLPPLFVVGTSPAADRSGWPVKRRLGSSADELEQLLQLLIAA